MSTRPNPHWPRWLKSSIVEHFQTNVATPLTLPFLAEGINERDTIFMESEDRAEIRIYGPTTKEISNNCWKLQIEINILITSSMGGSAKNAYQLEILSGRFLEFANTAISIFKFGSGIDDDNSLLGCLSPSTRKNDSVKFIDFGQINSTDKLRQAQIDGRYEMILNTQT